MQADSVYNRHPSGYPAYTLPNFAGPPANPPWRQQGLFPPRFGWPAEVPGIRDILQVSRSLRVGGPPSGDEGQSGTSYPAMSSW
jgi:hypothetical protein